MRMLILSFVLLCACNSLLGIEDLQVKPDASTTSVAQREQDVTVTTDAGPRPPAAANSGTGAMPTVKEPDAGSDSGTKPSTAGNDAPSPAQAAGSGGAPPETTEATSPVTGTLVDYRMRKLSGVSIKIGDQETTTDAEGKFTIP
ncbi:MAG TPA: hypothetical protein VMF89_01430, partial [Polyangiales bacterium]|nr:hypothetical protein [Polyangiales bacterium]